MADSIKIPAQYNDMFKDMCTDKKNQQVFETYKDLLLFSASLGKSRDSSIKFNNSTLDPVRLSYFRGDYDLDLLNCIAILEEDDPSILGKDSEDKRIEVIEEYINGGLKIIHNDIYSKPGNWEDHLINLIISEQEEQTNPLDDITSAWV